MGKQVRNGRKTFRNCNCQINLEIFFEGGYRYNFGVEEFRKEENFGFIFEQFF